MSSQLITNAIPAAQIAIAASSFTASYTNGGNFSVPIEMMTIVSTLDQPVQLSFDGINDHIAVPAGDTVPVFMRYDFKGNRMILPPKTVFIKEIGNPTTGSLYISLFRATIP